MKEYAAVSEDLLEHVLLSRPFVIGSYCGGLDDDADLLYRYVYLHQSLPVDLHVWKGLMTQAGVFS
jgi:hypothetical protein